jgi:hypothetical protein
MKKLVIKKVRDLPDLKKSLSLSQLQNRLQFDEKILNQGLIMILEKELEMTDRVASKKELNQFALLED